MLSDALIAGQGPPCRIRHRDRCRDISPTFARRGLRHRARRRRRARGARSRACGPRTASCSGASPRAAAQAHADARLRLRRLRRPRDADRASCSTRRAGDAMSSANGTVHARRRCSTELRARERFVCATHENPDGDALGSLVGDARDPDARSARTRSCSWPPTSSRCPTSTASSSSTALVSAPPADIDERTIVFLDCGNIDRNAGRRAAARRGAHPQHRPPPRQHALRHRQPRRAGGVVHGRDRVGPVRRPRRRR